MTQLGPLLGELSAATATPELANGKGAMPKSARFVLDEGEVAPSDGDVAIPATVPTETTNAGAPLDLSAILQTAHPSVPQKPSISFEKSADPHRADTAPDARLSYSDALLSEQAAASPVKAVDDAPDLGVTAPQAKTQVHAVSIHGPERAPASTETVPRTAPAPVFDPMAAAPSGTGQGAELGSFPPVPRTEKSEAPKPPLASAVMTPNSPRSDGGDVKTSADRVGAAPGTAFPPFVKSALPVEEQEPGVVGQIASKPAETEQRKLPAPAQVPLAEKGVADALRTVAPENSVRPANRSEGAPTIQAKTVAHDAPPAEAVKALSQPTNSLAADQAVIAPDQSTAALPPARSGDGRVTRDPTDGHQRVVEAPKPTTTSGQSTAVQSPDRRPAPDQLLLEIRDMTVQVKAAEPSAQTAAPAPAPAPPPTAPTPSYATPIPAVAAPAQTGKRDMFAFGDVTIDMALGDRPSDPVESQRLTPKGDAPGFFRAPETTRAVLTQLADAVRQNAPGTVEVSLHPEELGRLQLVFSETETGLSVSISADRSETLDLLRRHATILAEELRNLGYDGAAFSFSEGSSGQQNAPDGHDQRSVESASIGRSTDRPQAHTARATIGETLDLRL